MIKSLLLLAGIYLQCCSAATAQKLISVSDFGAIPNDAINDRTAIQQALNFCKIHHVKKLLIPAGKYMIREERAVQLMNDIMDGKMGKNPQDIIFTPYYPYSKGLDFTGISHLEVEASGALFLVQGWMEPISLEHCNNISIRGLTIDHETAPHSEGEIINETEDYIYVSFLADFPV